jgi:hypothetical protein
MASREAVAIGVGALCEAFGRTPTQATYEAYRIGLAGVDDAGLERAVGCALRTRKFMPAPVELRELAGEVPPQTRAMVAWEVVRRSMHAAGEYRSVDFDDQVVNATVRNLGGWVELCEHGDDELEQFIRPRFCKVYEALYATGVSAEAGAPLVGIHEAYNRAAGYIKHANQVDAPVLIPTGLPTVQRIGAESRPAIEGPPIDLSHVLKTAGGERRAIASSIRGWWQSWAGALGDATASVLASGVRRSRRPRWRIRSR